MSSIVEIDHEAQQAEIPKSDPAPSQGTARGTGASGTRRRKRSARGIALGVENDVGGPTSVYRGSVQGITQVVTIGHNRQRGVKLGTGLPGTAKAKAKRVRKRS